jgi:hypothetical protein
MPTDRSVFTVAPGGSAHDNSVSISASAFGGNEIVILSLIRSLRQCINDTANNPVRR